MIAVSVAVLLGFAVIAYLARRPGVITVPLDGFAEDSPRERKAKALALVQKAEHAAPGVEVHVPASTTITYSKFAEDSPRERQRKAKALVAKALGSVDAPARKARSVSRKARKK